MESGALEPAEVERLRAVSLLLREGRTQEASPIVLGLLSGRVGEGECLASLERRYAREGASEALLAALLAAPDATFGTLPGAALALRLAAMLEDSARATRLLEEYIAAGGLARFGVLDHLAAYQDLPPESRTLVARLKYSGLPEGDGRGVDVLARGLAKRLEVDRRIARFLHERHSGTPFPYAAWLEEMRFGIASDHVLMDLRFAAPHVDLGDEPIERLPEEDLVAAAKPLFGEPPWQGPRLLVLAHCGPAQWAAIFARRCFPDAFALAMNAGAPDRIAVDQDSRAALFHALRVLLAGNALLVAPDGGLGRATSEIRVLGSAVTLADGASFLAYEADCPATFVTADYQGERFMPLLIAAPERRQGETYRDFRDRWNSFYAEQIARLLTGNPSRIGLRSRWLRVLARGSAPATPGAGDLQPRSDVAQPESFQQLREISRSLRLGRPAAARPIVSALLARGSAFDSGLAALDRRYALAGRSEALLEALLEEPAAAFASLRRIAFCLRLAHRLGRTEVAKGALEQHLRAGRPPTFDTLDYLAGFSALRPEGQSLLALAKYSGLAISDGGGLSSRAPQLAERVSLDPRLIRTLYTSYSGIPLSLSEWEAGMRLGVATDHLLRESALAVPHVGLEGSIFDPLSEPPEPELIEAVQPFLGPPPWRGPRLLVMAHCGPLPWTVRLVLRLFPELVALGLGPVTPRRISVRDDTRAALLAALRLLEAGGTLLLAPDGGLGRAHCVVSVLGGPARVGEGAAFLAYETRCPNVFCSGEFRRGRFEPILVPGPEPRRGETYARFRDRWNAFYAEQTAALLSGPPSRISVDGRWFAALSARWRGPEPGRPDPGPEA